MPITEFDSTLPVDKIPVYVADGNPLQLWFDVHAFLDLEGDPLAWVDGYIDLHELTSPSAYRMVRHWKARPVIPAVACYLSEDTAVALSLSVNSEKGNALYEFVKRRKILEEGGVDIANVGAGRNVPPFDPDGEVIIARIRHWMSQRALDLVSEVAPSSCETVPVEKIPSQTKIGDWLYTGLQALMWRDLEDRYPYLPEMKDERSELAVFLANWRPSISSVSQTENPNARGMGVNGNA